MNKFLRRYFSSLFLLATAIFFFVLPLILLIMLSLTDETSLLENGYSLIPQEFSLSAYKALINNHERYASLFVFTVVQAIASTLSSLLIMSLGAYVLSRGNYVFSKAVNAIVFTSYFLKWGFVATYYINTRILNLYDTFFVYILPNLVDIYYLLILKSFYSKIGKTILRSSHIDGAGEVKTFLYIAFPLSLPLVFAIGILLFIYRWNDWFTSMLYVNNGNLYTLQYYLQRINREEEFIRSMLKDTTGSALAHKTPIYTLRFAMGVISTIPLVFLTPLFRKATTYCNVSLE